MQEQIDELNRKLDRVLAHYEQENFADRMVLYRALQLKDKNQITVLDSGNNGIKIGSTGSKVGFYNTTPVVQAGAIASPAGGATVDGPARAAIDAIRVALTNIGITL